MRPLDDPEIRDWIAKVAEDIRVADVLAEQDEPLDDAICFHCQQAVEKLLKALLVAHDRCPPKTHDLEELAALLSPSPALPEAVEAALTYLTGFAVIPRYPVRVELRAPGRAVRARAARDVFIDWVRGAVGWDTPRRPLPPAPSARR